MVAGKTFLKTTSVFLLYLICSLLQAACSLQIENRPIITTATIVSDIGDGGFLSGKYCGPPCFSGIVPGKTTKEDAVEMLRVNGLYDSCTEFDNSTQGGVRGINCDSVVITLQNRSNVVIGIGFSPSQPVTVEEVIAKHGEPDAILVAAIGATEKQLVTGMTLYYDSINAVLGLSEQNSGEFELKPTTLVSGIQYFDTGEYQLQRQYFQDWKGYGVYKQWNP